MAGFTRREVIKAVGTVAALPLCERVALAADRSPATERVLVQVELSGGNDALNTIVPFRDASYRSLRPQLACSGRELRQLTDRYAWHRQLDPLTPALLAGDLWIGVGACARQAGLSHTTAARLWDTGLSARGVIQRQWWHTANAAFGASPRQNALTPLDPMRLHLLRRTATLEQKLLVVADAIKSDTSSHHVRVDLPGFDTHTAQQRTHPALLGQLSEALANLRARLIKSAHWHRTLIVVHSEFGRAVAQNAAAGTDHGLASVVLVMGGGVYGGIDGDYRPLSDEAGAVPTGTLQLDDICGTVRKDWWLQSHDRTEPPANLGFLRTL